MPGPLSGIKILDFTWAQQGPYATVILSDMGAEIIKVERRIIGDMGRGIAASGWDPSQGFRPYFWAHDRGKKSITVDLTKPEAREIILKLAEKCDVAVNNFRPEVMAKLGIGYEDMKARNPKIIYANACALGSRGPKAHRPGLDIVGQAMGGIMSVTGLPDTPPQPAGAAIADQIGAIHLAMGILSALVARERFGVGQQVEVSLYGSVVGLQAWEIDNYSIMKEPPKRSGRGHQLIPGLWGSFQTADGWMVIGGVSDARWPAFCQALGIPELATDERFDHGLKRMQNRDILVPLVEERLRQHTTAEWMDKLDRLDVIGAPVQTYDDIINDPQALANDYIVEMEDPVRGPVKIVGCPIRLTETPTKPQGAPPELGQHTEEILLELGYSWEEIERLKDGEVI